MAAPATVGGEPHPAYATGETWEGRMWAMTREPVYLPLTRYRISVRRGVRAQSTRSNLANRGEKNGVSGEKTFVGSVDMFFSRSFFIKFAGAFLVFSVFGFRFLRPKFSGINFGARMAGIFIGGFGAATLFGQFVS